MRKRMSRLYKINKVFWQYGLDEILPLQRQPWSMRLAGRVFFWLKNQHADKSPGARLRLALQDLGPVFIKFGQMLSTRRDLLNAEMATELAQLQDNVPPFSSDQAIDAILAGLKIKQLDEVFSEFEYQPLASASIAQVHGAVLKTDQQVVVKVIRPGIEAIINADIELLYTLAGLARSWLPDGERLRPLEVVEEYQKTLLAELDLLREAANGMQLRRNFEDSTALYVPEIYPDYCAENVLVMERIFAIPISDNQALQDQGTDFEKLAERGVEVFFTQVFRDSFFHADMHPGNIFVSCNDPSNPQYIAIDFGIVGTLNREDKRYLAENFVAFFNRDYRKVAVLHVDSGWVPSDTDIDEFEIAIRTVCDPIFNKPLAEISFGQVLVQLFNTARCFNMQVQPQLVLLQKTLLYIEGLGRHLYPQLDLWKTAKPFLEQWMKEQMGIKAMFNKVQANFPYWSEKLPEVPDLLFDSLQQLKQMPEQQRKQAEQQLAEQQRAHKSTRYLLIGSTLLVIACLLPLNGLHWSWSILAVLAGVGAWITGFVNH